jgi:hypothetical protein
MKTSVAPKILHLSTSETALIRALDAPKNVTQLATETRIPRTSIGYMLESLEERGIVLRTIHGKRFVYSLAQKEALSRLTDEVRTFFDPSLSMVTTPSFDGLRVYKGVDAIIALHREMLEKQPRHSRVKAIQPNASFLNLFDRASIEQMITLNTAINESGAIMDAVVEKDAYKVYEEYWKLDPEGFSRLNPTFLNRTTDYVALDRKSIPFVNELWIYFDSVVISNWKDGLAVMITNQETRGLLEVLYDTLKMTGTKVNHAEEIQRVGR